MRDDQEKSWWDRYWYWVISIGCLGPILLAGGCVALWVSFFSGAVGSFEPYELAVEKVLAHAAVVEALGEPIEPGWPEDLSVSVRASSGDGDTEFEIPLAGPRGEGTLSVVAHKSSGDWVFDSLEVHLGESADPIDLLSGAGETRGEENR